MNKQSRTKKIILLTKRNIFFALIILTISVVGLISIYKFIFPHQEYVYVKIKVGTGYWWTNTPPPIWLLQSLQENSSTNPNIKVVGINNYPKNNGNDVYLKVKLKATRIKKSEYKYNRSTISIGSPIELKINQSAITGTVIDFSLKPFNNDYITKIVTLVGNDKSTYGTSILSENISVGDIYFDGEKKTIEIIDINITNLNNTSTKLITLKLKVLVQKKNNQFVYGEEYPIFNNGASPFSTNSYSLVNFTIIDIQ